MTLKLWTDNEQWQVLGTDNKPKRVQSQVMSLINFYTVITSEVAMGADNMGHHQTRLSASKHAH